VDHPNEFILDPNQPVQDVANHFAPQLVVLDSLIAYGTSLLPRCLRASERGLADAIAIGSLLRHFVAMLDASTLLIKEGAVYCVAPHLRSMLESSLYFEWMLREDSEQRARAFYVADLRRELLWAQRGVTDTPQAKEIERSMAQMGVELTISKVTRERAAQVESEIQTLLDRDAYRTVNGWFDENRRGRLDAPWYASSGPKNLREMARMLSREGEYDLMYGPASDVAHATALSRQVWFSNGEMHVIPIRHLAALDTVVRSLCVLSFRTYRTALDRYRVEESTNFARKYIAEWRAAFMTIPHPHYDEGTATRIDL
jgi:hypothetical protein